jgi:signal peptidase I
VLITHRITAVIRSAGGATLYATRGDHNPTDDPAPVPASNVVAVYQFHVPLAGYLLRFAHAPAGFTTLLLAPVVWLVAFELVRMWRRTPRAVVSGRAGNASHEEAPLMP